MPIMANARRALRKAGISESTALLPDLVNIICDYASNADMDALCLLVAENCGLPICIQMNGKYVIPQGYLLMIIPAEGADDYEFKTYFAKLMVPGAYPSHYKSQNFPVDVLFDAKKLWQQFDHPQRDWRYDSNAEMHTAWDNDLSNEFTRRLRARMDKFM